VGAERFFPKEADVLYAGFLHNHIFWESQIARMPTTMSSWRHLLARRPSRALYQCLESFNAPRLPASGRAGPLREPALLICQYRRHALFRAWHYSPDALPLGLEGSEQRNDHVDGGLSIAMAELYANGQVGQEV
jgi:hypothetical protein